MIRAVKSRDVGVILNVTPRIAPETPVILDTWQQVSSVAPGGTAAGDNPVVSQRRLQSRITALSGSAILLGGLLPEPTARAPASPLGVPVDAVQSCVSAARRSTSVFSRFAVRVRKAFPSELPERA